MKAKDLVLGSPVYRAETDSIRVYRVIGLKMVAGDVRVTLNGLGVEECVKPDAAGIIPENPAFVRYYFDLPSAQKRQLRLREDRIQAAKENLENAAQHYAEVYAKYHDTPVSEPTE